MSSSLPSTEAQFAIGVDVGGTKCLGVIWSAGKIVAELRRPTPNQSPEGPGGVVAVIAEVVADLETQIGVSQSGLAIPVGVGMPGLVTRSGIVRASPNLRGVADLAVRGLLEERLQRPVWVDNDATCAAIAEWRTGAGAGLQDMVMVTLGTGIGGGIIANGAVVRGAHGFAGEIGHMVLDPDGPPCPCGQRGCWERFASGSALESQADQIFGPGKVRGADLSRLAAEGDQQAQEIFRQFSHWVALGLANLTNIFDPSVIVIGGGVTRTAPLFLKTVQDNFATLLYSPHLRPQPKIVVASLDERAGAVGAALLAGLDP